jgi:hypothetical protein
VWPKERSKYAKELQKLEDMGGTEKKERKMRTPDGKEITHEDPLGIVALQIGSQMRGDDEHEENLSGKEKFIRFIGKKVKKKHRLKNS